MTKTPIQGKIQDFAPDQRNANKGTERGNHLLTKALQELGAGRSILVDKNNRIIAGNKTWQKFGEVGLEDVLIVPTDGKTLVAVKRVDIDLDSPEGRALAIEDNRVGEINLDWDEPVLKEIHAEQGLEDWFTIDEIENWDAETADWDKYSDVNDRDIQSAAGELNEQFNKGFPEKESVICPHCGGEFLHG